MLILVESKMKKIENAIRRAFWPLYDIEALTIMKI